MYSTPGKIKETGYTPLYYLLHKGLHLLIHPNNTAKAMSRFDFEWVGGFLGAVSTTMTLKIHH